MSFLWLVSNFFHNPGTPKLFEKGPRFYCYRSNKENFGLNCIGKELKILSIIVKKFSFVKPAKICR